VAIHSNINRIRMLEDSSYQHVVRWSELGDSFVVLDVRSPFHFHSLRDWEQLLMIDKRVYEERITATFQTFEFREFCSAIK
jgi:hypothetical protein